MSLDDVRRKHGVESNRKKKSTAIYDATNTNKVQ